MKIVTSINDFEVMKREALFFHNRYLLIFVIIGFFVLFILLIRHFIYGAKNTLYVLLCVFYISILFLNVVNNIYNANMALNLYGDNGAAIYSIEITDDLLIIDNDTLNAHTEIDRKKIDKIIYLKHTIMIYTTDNVVHILPNCSELKYYINNFYDRVGITQH